MLVNTTHQNHSYAQEPRSESSGLLSNVKYVSMLSNNNNSSYLKGFTYITVDILIENVIKCVFLIFDLLLCFTEKRTHLLKIKNMFL